MNRLIERTAFEVGFHYGFTRFFVHRTYSRFKENVKKYKQCRRVTKYYIDQLAKENDDA